MLEGHQTRTRAKAFLASVLIIVGLVCHNLLVIVQEWLVTNEIGSLGEDFNDISATLSLENCSYVEKVNSQNQTQQEQTESPIVKEKSRVLLGVFSSGGPDDLRYRSSFRELLPLLEPRVCKLSDYLNLRNSTLIHCELVYTFVLAHPSGASMPAFQVDASRDILIPASLTPQEVNDNNQTDLTWLNIADNMNDGKSVTWLYYASQQPGIDFVAKTDTDTLLFLDLFFRFKDDYLHESNKRVIAGMFADPNRVWSSQQLKTQSSQAYRRKYGSLSLYVLGQFYLLSVGVARVVVQEAQRTQHNADYLVRFEDHDITAMAVHASSQPLQFIPLGKEEVFWRHPVKIGAKFGPNWKGEIERIEQRVERLDVFNLILPNDTFPAPCTTKPKCSKVLTMAAIEYAEKQEQKRK